MKKLFWILALCLPLGVAFAQEQCGFDQLMNIQQQNPEFVKSINDMNKAIEQCKANHPDNSNQRNNGSSSTLAVSGNALYVIPVVVHIVLDPGNPINNTTVSYARVQSQIDALNAAYAKNGLA